MSRPHGFRLAARTSALGVLLLALLVPSAISAQNAPPAGETAQREGRFEAQWSVTGTREELPFGTQSRQAIFRHTGQVTVLRTDGLVRSALSRCIGLSDSTNGTTERCVWVADGGAEIYSELQHLPAQGGQSGKGAGRFVGGTGRFAGIEGSYELRWVDRPQPTTEEMAAETISMRGHWRIRPQAPARAR